MKLVKVESGWALHAGTVLCEVCKSNPAEVVHHVRAYYSGAGMPMMQSQMEFRCGKHVFNQMVRDALALKAK